MFMSGTIDTAVIGLNVCVYFCLMAFFPNVMTNFDFQQNICHGMFSERPRRSVSSCSQGTMGRESGQDQRNIPIWTFAQLEANVSHCQGWRWFETRTVGLPTFEEANGEHHYFCFYKFVFFFYCLYCELAIKIIISLKWIKNLFLE